MPAGTVIEIASRLSVPAPLPTLPKIEFVPSDNVNGVGEVGSFDRSPFTDSLYVADFAVLVVKATKTIKRIAAYLRTRPRTRSLLLLSKRIGCPLKCAAYVRPLVIRRQNAFSRAVFGLLRQSPLGWPRCSR